MGTCAAAEPSSIAGACSCFPASSMTDSAGGADAGALEGDDGDDGAAGIAGGASNWTWTSPFSGSGMSSTKSCSYSESEPASARSS